MKKTFRFAWVLTGIALTGCGGDSDELGFSIYGTPQRLHVPSDAHFELTRDDGMGVETCRGEWDFGDGVTLAGEYEATHRYREPGTYRVEVDLTCSGRRGHSAMEIEAYDSVDLAVTSLEAPAQHQFKRCAGRIVSGGESGAGVVESGDIPRCVFDAGERA